MPKKPQGKRSYLIEYIQRGTSIKVTALDPETGVEASIVGATSVSQADLDRIAIRKLEYVLNKKMNEMK